MNELGTGLTDNRQRYLGPGSTSGQILRWSSRDYNTLPLDQDRGWQDPSLKGLGSWVSAGRRWRSTWYRVTLTSREMRRPTRKQTKQRKEQTQRDVWKGSHHSPTSSEQSQRENGRGLGIDSERKTTGIARYSEHATNRLWSIRDWTQLR